MNTQRRTFARYSHAPPSSGTCGVHFGCDISASKKRAHCTTTHAVGHTEAEAIELAWHIRDGLLGIVGAMHPQGSILIIEDVHFPPAQLANATRDLLDLLTRHGYKPAAAGHAAYGNLHFAMIEQLSRRSRSPTVRRLHA